MSSAAEAPGRRRELLVALAAGTLLFAVTLVPYLLAGATAPAGKVFNGFFFIADDAATYVSKMREGADGAWGWRDPYISTPVAQPVLLFLFYIAWGKLAALAHVSMFVGYHAARWSGAVALVGAARSLARACLPAGRPRVVAVVLALLGSGLGWVLQLVAALTGVHQVLGQHLEALELHLPELSGFYSILAIPHFAWAAALMAWAAVGLLELSGPRRGIPWGTVAWTTVVLLALCLIHPQMLFVLALLAAIHLATSRRPASSWAVVAGPFAACLPLLVYFLVVLTADPVIAAWSSQWRHQAPEPLGFVVALGLPLVLAGVAVTRGERPPAPALRLMAAWVVVVLVLLYLPNPVNIQRRLVDGVYLPVAMLAAAGLEVVLASRARRPAGPFRAPGPLVTLAVGLSVLMSVLVWTTGITAAAGHEPIIYVDRGEIAAIEWLGAQPHGALPPAVLSHPDTGLFIPERSGYRVYVGHYSETVDYLKKARAAFDAFHGGEPELVALMRREGVEYLFVGPLERIPLVGAPPGSPVPDAAGLGSPLVPVYSRDGVTIFRLRG